MSGEVIEKAISSITASTESKSEDHLINSKGKIDRDRASSDIKRKEKPVPHYLRASTGSCHDNCKYGIQHSFQPAKYRPVRRAHRDWMNTGNEERHQASIIQQGVKPRNKDHNLKISDIKDGSTHAKPKFTKPKAPPGKVPDLSESSSSTEELPAEASAPVVVDTPASDAKCSISPDNVINYGDGELSEGAVSIELEMPLAIQESDASDEHISDAILPADDARTSLEQAPMDHMSHGSSKECVGVGSAQTSLEMVTASKKREQAKHWTKPASPSKKSVIPKAKADATIKFNKDKKFSSPVASVAPKAKNIKVPFPVSATDSSAKLGRSLKLKASAMKASSPSLSSGNKNDRKIRANNFPKSAQFWQKEGEEKVTLGLLKLSRSVNMPIKSLSSINMGAFKKEKSASPIKNNKKTHGTEISAAAAGAKEKILQTVTPRVRRPEVNNKENQSHKDKAETTPRNGGARGSIASSFIPSSNAMQSPRKLTFRRGKLLNLHSSSETNSPRRLRFRPAKVTDDNSKGKEQTRGRITRKTVNTATAAKDSATSGAQAVVLKHQDVMDKKNDQGLFNNVIEETASKLVETRKSKVKALVGAFETVISLQENKSTAPSTAAP